MPFLGNSPSEVYKSVAKQVITGTGALSYALDNTVTSANELEVFVNNVRQEPGVAYTASGALITFTDALSASDSCYVIFQGRAVQSNVIQSQNLQDGAVTPAKLDRSYVNKTGDTMSGPLVVGSTGGSWGQGTFTTSVNNTAAAATNITDYLGATVIIHNQDQWGGNKSALAFSSAGAPGLCSVIEGYRESGSSWKTGLRFYTNNLTGGSVGTIQKQMDITPDGYVISPKNPYFFARPAAGYSLPNETIVGGTWSIESNIGNNFNASNGIFTAPVAGVYSITWGALITSTYTRRDSYIFVNGVQRARNEINMYNVTSNMNICSHVHAELYLSAGDNVQFALYGGGATASIYSGGAAPWSYACGHLVG